MNDLSATDRCVKCGLCLPVCPTFGLSGNEADSPRGRITLIQSLDGEAPLISPGLFRHLDSCLQCRSCEAMCPSKVPFGRLMDTAQQRLKSRRTIPLHRKLLSYAGLGILAHPPLLTTAGAIARLWQKSGLQALTRAIPWLPSRVRRLNAILPTRFASHTAAATDIEQAGPRVQLFLGCVSRVLDQRTLDAARSVLQAQGFRVETPDGQTCCGALHLHTGDAHTAAKLERTNIEAFQGTWPVISCASGCSARLIEYSKQASDAQARAFAERVEDIAHFVLLQGRGSLSLAPLGKRVAMYFPCTHTNVLAQAEDIPAILSWIPDIELLTVNPEGGCCGAAGSFMLTRPELADQLRERVIERIAQLDADLLVTSNIGCALHIQAGLREQRLDIEVLHPVELLARQLEPVTR